MPLISSITKFARSRQGRAAFNHARRYAQSPQGRAKIDQVRKQLASRGQTKRRRAD